MTADVRGVIQEVEPVIVAVVETDHVVNGNVAEGNPLAGVLLTANLQFSKSMSRALHAGLGVVCALSLKERNNCLVVILEGPPGIGKSEAVRALEPIRPATKKVLMRKDNFTPASFVSHASNKTEEQLGSIDLLPQLVGKTMLTKELATLFGADDKQLKTSFGMLTSVLDGNGLDTHSGTHGQRSYAEESRDYTFNWFGATTPIPVKTREIMSTMGNRMLFCDVPGRKITRAEVNAQSDEVQSRGKALRKMVNDLVEAHFAKHPVSSVHPYDVRIPDPIKARITDFAFLITGGRVETVKGEGDEWEGSFEETPWRVNNLMKMLARGLALAANRDHVNEDDLAVLQHVALSSLNPKRRQLVKLLVANGGKLTTPQFVDQAGISKGTALERMKELAAVGMVVYVKDDAKAKSPAYVTWAPEWEGGRSFGVIEADSLTAPKTYGNKDDSLSEGPLPAAV